MNVVDKEMCPSTHGHAGFCAGDIDHNDGSFTCILCGERLPYPYSYSTSPKLERIPGWKGWLLQKKRQTWQVTIHRPFDWQTITVYEDPNIWGKI